MGYAERRFAAVEVVQNIPFANVRNERGEQEELTLDVYLPEGDTEVSRPVILWVHGGGFRPGNDKRQKYIVEFATRCARRGFVGVSTDYRLREQPKIALQGTISEAVADVTEALEWIRTHHTEYGIDLSRIFIAGGSAGGKIVVNLVYGDGTYGLVPDLNGVLGIINFWGTPDDLTLLLHPDSLPVYIVHGTADTLVPYQNSVSFTEQLREQGIPCTLLTLEGAPHTPVGHADQIDEELTKFLQSLLSK